MLYEEGVGGQGPNGESRWEAEGSNEKGLREGWRWRK